MYPHQSIENKWQRYWEEQDTFECLNPELENSHKPKFYALDMFPYPSGAGLHVGHPKGYTATDIIARYKHAKGYHVLHPMGWDAFGLPAENYAIKTGTHPSITTANNITHFREQLKKFGFSFDWNREVDTTDPEYYKWSQWIFLKLFEGGLAYESDKPINFCPSCKTGLANEEVVDGKCERCGTPVEKRPIRQWVLAITKYADRLLSDIDRLDWPEGIKEMQRNWIGRSEGCQFTLQMAENGREMSENEVKITENKRKTKEDFGDKTFEIIGCAMKAHRELGPGLREEIYTKGLKILLEKAGFNVEIEKKIEYKIEGEKVGYGYIDILVNGSIAIELKSRKNLEGDFYKQLRAYIQHNTNVETGFLLNFYNKKLEYKRLERNYSEIGNTDILCDSLGNSQPFLEVFTTRIDTVYGMTYVVVAPDHPAVASFITPEYEKECQKYIEKTKSESDQDRTNEKKEKTGVFTGSYVINPYNGEKVPVWIADYVLGNYGTGAVMAVPAHDERDWDFAKKYKLPIVQSIAKNSQGSISRLKEGMPIIPRKCIEGIVYNPKTDAFLCLQWKNEAGWMTFVTGGIEEGESSIDSAVREISEETGYEHLRYVGPVGPINASEYYHPLKGINRRGMFSSHLFVLEDAQHNDISAEEEEKHTVLWLSLEEIEKKGLIFTTDCLSTLKKLYEKKDIWTEIDASEYLIGTSAFTEDGILVNSDIFTGITSAEGRIKLTEKAEQEGFGKKVTNYKLRDWIFSRQRYWGEPIPLIHISNENYEQLPLIGEKDNIPYITLSCQSAPRSENNIKKFDPVNAIVKHWSEEKYIVLTFKNGEKGLVGGSVENGETREEAIIREVREETGYKNIRIENVVIPEIYSRGYKARKDLEEEAKESIYLVSILNDEKIDLGIEEGIVGCDWIARENVSDFISLSHHKFYWNYFHTTDFPYRVQKSDGIYLYVSGKEVSKIYDGLSSKIITDSNLPLTLPEVEKYEPSGDGQSPLATIPDWVNVRLGSNLVGKRETNTMPQWAGSCWYYLRYMDPKNSAAIVDPAVVKYWGEVDSYIGGAEHAVLHLLYARFWHKFLFDIGVVPSNEPFFKLRNVGLILGPDGEKMSKSRGNVVNPDEVIEEYGADTLRMYEMSMADFSDVSPWNTKAIIGNYRLLERIYRLFSADEASEEFKAFLAADDMKAIKTMHKTIKKVGEDIENMKFNTAISMLNVMMNEGAPTDADSRQEWKCALIRLLHPFAPHVAEECWSLLGNIESIYETEWPEYIEALTIDDEVMIAVQINGKLRGTYPFMRGVTADEVRMTIESKPEIAKWLEGATILKEIYIPNKILNIVIKND